MLYTIVTKTQIKKHIMSKTLNFNVAITFSDKITDDETILDIAKNIVRAIVNEANNGYGITPDYADAFTEEVAVKPQFLDEVVSKKICED